jgi:DNA-binding transcriptional ArsR family regulator
MLELSLDLVFRALGDPTRRRMVERLSRGPASVSELAEPFDMSLAAVVQHLGVLEESGLVRSEKQGRVRTCRLDSAALDAAERWIHARKQVWDERFDRLAALLEDDGKPPVSPAHGVTGLSRPRRPKR